MLQNVSQIHFYSIKNGTLIKIEILCFMLFVWLCGCAVFCPLYLVQKQKDWSTFHFFLDISTIQEKICLRFAFRFSTNIVQTFLGASFKKYIYSMVRSICLLGRVTSLNTFVYIYPGGMSTQEPEAGSLL